MVVAALLASAFGLSGCGGSKSSYDKGYEACYDAILNGGRDERAPTEDSEWMDGCYAGVEAASESRR